MHNPLEKHERNKDILLRLANGQSAQEVADHYRISRQAVWYIYERYRRREHGLTIYPELDRPRKP